MARRRRSRLVAAQSDGVKAAAKRAAREAESRPALRLLARGGFAANGVVHIVVGAIVIAVAAGGRGESDQAGALKAVTAAPLGFVALWFLAIALGALGVWHALEGFLARADEDDAKAQAAKWARRAGEWTQALAFVALGLIAVSVALGARPDGEHAAEATSRGILSLPGGPLVLAAAGVAIGGCGLAFVVMGIRRSFRKKMRIPSTGPGRATTALGVVGFVAKGGALVVVGVLLLVAAITLDPSTAGGLDGAIDALLGLAAGPRLVGAVGGGLVAYGVFNLFRARYARL